MFLGRYEHTIDEKGRMTIPARYRELLGDSPYVMHGLFDHNLLVMTAITFEILYDRLSEMSAINEDANDLWHLVFPNAEQLEKDKVGRILIPSPMREFAQLSDTAVVLGVGRFFEIWSPELWTVKSAQQDPSLIKKFSAFDLSLR
jgi:MraZ protein